MQDAAEFLWQYVGPARSARHQTDASLVRAAADLPPVLMMGYRDDQLFERLRVGFRVAYRNNQETVATLSYNGDALELTETWEGVEHSRTVVHGTMLPELVRNYLPSNHWDAWFQSRVEDLGNFHYVSLASEETKMVSFPGGIAMNIVMPVAATRLAKLTDLYRDLDGAYQHRPTVGGYTVLSSDPVVFVQVGSPAAADLERMRELLRREAVSRLDCPQKPLPDARLETYHDRPIAVFTQQRRAYVHTCQTSLRDVLTVCQALVARGFVAPEAAERAAEPPTDPLWGSALYRAFVCPAAASMKTLGINATVPGVGVGYRESSTAFIEHASALAEGVTEETIDQWRRIAADTAAAALRLRDSK